MLQCRYMISIGGSIMIQNNKIDYVIKLAKGRQAFLMSKEENLYNQFNSLLQLYLEQLNFEEIKSLRAIMYLGQDETLNTKLTSDEIYEDYLNYLNSDLKNTTQQIKTEQILEKTPLGDYLEKGKRKLQL